MRKSSSIFHLASHLRQGKWVAAEDDIDQPERFRTVLVNSLPQPFREELLLHYRKTLVHMFANDQEWNLQWPHPMAATE